MRKKPSDLVSGSGVVEEALRSAKALQRANRAEEMYKVAIQIANMNEARIDALTAITGVPAISKFSKMKRTYPDGVSVIVPATDWHVEETISKSRTGGKNSQSISSVEKKITRYYQKIVELIDWQSKIAKVCELWHPILGDLMSGYIHEELMETNSLSPTEACVFLRDQICSGVEFLLKETKLPIMIPTCVGNHGRTTQKMRIKTSCSNSYEWLLYKTLEKIFQKNKRVAMMVGDGYHNIQTIVGRKVRFHHGDGLRYLGGVGGITIPVNKAIAQWDKVESVDFDIFGHWHTFMAHYPKWIACGSMMGFNEFSIRIKAEFQHPTQTFIVLDRRYGLTLATPIFLTDPKRV